MMSAKDEKNAVYATLFFQVAHYCIRPWPWILVALSALLLYPDIDDPKMGFVFAMRDYLPAGLKGLLLVAFLAAYMSTISTQLNWGASYVVNDLYKRFMDKTASDKKLIKVSRIVTLILMGLGLTLSGLMNSVSGMWTFIIECGAGLGLVLILRWYWWRINAWSEISATITPFIAYAISHFVFDWSFPDSFFFTVGTTTITWLIVTYFTPPTAEDKLHAFYQKVRPDGVWGPYKELSNESGRKSQLKSLFICWIFGVVMTYALLIGIGKLIFMEWLLAGISLGVAIISFVVLSIALRKTNILN